MYTQTVMNIICITGIIAFAVSGAMVAIQKHADPFGVMVLAVITATGGGIMRDTLLGILPPKIFTDCTYVCIAAASALIVFLIAHINKETYQSRSQTIDKINNIFDALGLGVFAVMGTQAALDYGFCQNAFFVIFIGTITGVGGGFFRDIMVQEIPFVLKKHIYALAAIAGSSVYYILYIQGADYTIAAFTSAAVTFLLRMLATHFRWNLPPAY